jgi:hypothetical protein
MFKIFTVISVICSPLVTECINLEHKQYFFNNQACNDAAHKINLTIVYPGTTINNYCKEKKLWQA